MLNCVNIVIEDLFISMTPFISNYLTNLLGLLLAKAWILGLVNKSISDLDDTWQSFMYY